MDDSDSDLGLEPQEDEELELEDDDEELDGEEAADARSGPGAKDVYKADELHEKLEDIQWEGVSFIDTQATTCEPEETIRDIDDDLQRELYFYSQALEGVRSAVTQLESAGVPWVRPADYYAEMVKSDAHMARVKQQLMFEQKKIDEAEERRKQREAKKAAKELQAERLKEKAQARKQSITQVDKLRKQRQRQGFAGDKRISKRRQAKNAHFGFGGRKRLGKQNDASSAADMDSYRGSGGGGGRGGRGRGKKGAQRPGKARRAAARGR